MIKLCECGCGQPTSIIKETQGEYRRFIQGHNLRLFTPWNKELTAKTDNRVLVGKNHPMTDRLHTKKARKKMSKALMARPYEWRHRKLSKGHKKKIGDGKRGKRNRNWKGEKPHCKDCGKLLSSYGGIYCHRCSQIGDKGSNWQGGIAPLNKTIRYSFEYAQWRLKIFQRDNYTCQKCKKQGGYLVAHHNKKSFKKIFQEFLQKYKQFSPVKDKNKLINLAVKYKPFWTAEGITYCDNCHKKEHTRLTKRGIRYD